MTFNLEPWQHPTLLYAGILVIQTFGYNVLQCVTAASTSAIRWPCSHCGATNHYPRNCPFRSQAIPAPTNGQRPTTTSTSNDGQQPISGGLPNFRPSTCHAYNRSTCRRQNCSFLHQCELCGADHSAKYCPNRGSTAQ